MKDNIEIPLSRIKLVLIILGCAMFLALSVFILLNAENMQTRKAENPFIMRAIAVIAILFFGAILISVFKKLFQNRMGMIISDKGIWDNSNGVSIGLIEWQDIQNIRKSQVMLTKFLLIDVKNPEKYLNNASSKFKASIMRRNMQTYGTPISISSGGLKWGFRKIESTIIREFKRQKQIPFMQSTKPTTNKDI
ncbi:STM3941 family protein [Allomuricauda sp. R78024]|uniref:STM3941 family protein n=1 Tax=Allomuricauda sp. R78024 TaxID=3093867 RepID=UPI0037C6A648